MQAAIIRNSSSIGQMNSPTAGQHIKTCLPMIQYPTHVVQMMVNFLYTGIMEKPGDGYSELFELLMAEYGLMTWSTLPMDRTALNELAYVGEETPQTPDADTSDKEAEVYKSDNWTETIRMKQEAMDSEETSQDHDTSDKDKMPEVIKSDNCNERIKIKQEVVSDTDDMWAALHEKVRNVLSRCHTKRRMDG